MTLVSSNFPMSNNLVKTKNVYDDLSFNLEVVKSLSEQEQLMFWDLIFYCPMIFLLKLIDQLCLVVGSKSSFRQRYC